ncbi:MAG: hypothetical protein HFE41_01650 [Clostridia bacterium]|jgi:hypothetical protein|nr:hypothetical protein [Clostridia bacterium]
MKKFITVLSCALLVVLLALTMAGCDASGGIKRAYEKAGYTVEVTSSKGNEWLESNLTEEQKKDLDKYAIIVCKKTTESATIIKFPSAGAIKEVLGEDGYDKAVESGLINGNCYLLLPLGLNIPKIIDIFKNA